ncbi:actin cytoskeleton-regulatory complex protein PAN1-like [Monomorium pharaonis]|uniref:actin cytoskeleton-regulatory complex protein PAN1-like n=1 Tax=Monomorium pharaonis TaxID=307658 RepID=UPI0017475BAD|nr:actin cytoskeleton-regulatory complex protein PAN1-like [Monomorium pharaonis]
MSPPDQRVINSSSRMPKARSSLRDRLARAIAGPPRIPTSSRPFEASARTPARSQRRENEPLSTAAPAPIPAPTPPSGPRRPAVARQRTTRSRQERLYAEAPPAVDNGRSVLLATFGSTLSDLDDDDDSGGESTAVPEERTTPAPMPDIAALRLEESGPTAPPAPAAPPPTAVPEPAPPPPPARPPSAAAKTATAELTQPPLPTPPPTPPASPGYFTRPQPTPTPTGYSTQPPPTPPSPATVTPTSPLAGQSVIPSEVLRTIPWERIPPGRRYRHQALGHRIVVKHQPDGSWYIH